MGRRQKNIGRTDTDMGKRAMKTAFGWIWFVAARYIFRRRGNSSSSVLAILGIATGVLALIVILSVMNGFQLGFIENILEVSSYHLRVESFPEERTQQALDVFRNIPGIDAALPFREFQALARGGRLAQQAVLIRGIPADAGDFDPGMIARLDFEDGLFDLSNPGSVLLGSELARRLGVKLGDELFLFSISNILSGESEEGAGTETFVVRGIFRTGYYEYDSGWGFINIESAAAFSGAGPVIGMKLKNRFQDRHFLEIVRRETGVMPDFQAAKFSAWRDYNRAFFGALRTEKLFMFILVGLIFIVVGLNIFQAQRRSVLEHREEIGLLRAVGGGEQAVRFVFVCDGALIGLSGAAAGLAAGLIIAFNISVFFTVIERLVNFFIGILNIFAKFFGAGAANDFSVFAPAVFYITEIPSRVIPREVALIAMFGFFSALSAAWFASGKVSRIRPAEVLRDE
jgi:lipoprotein-releasing system permease protein